MCYVRVVWHGQVSIIMFSVMVVGLLTCLGENVAFEKARLDG